MCLWIKLSQICFLLSCISLFSCNLFSKRCFFAVLKNSLFCVHFLNYIINKIYTTINTYTIILKQAGVLNSSVLWIVQNNALFSELFTLQNVWPPRTAYVINILWNYSVGFMNAVHKSKGTTKVCIFPV